MITLGGSIEPDGALVDLLVGLAAANVQTLRQAGQPVPAASAIRGILDPGAEITCLDGQVLAPLIALGLKPSRILLANVPALGGVSAATEYTVSLTLVHPSGNPGDNLVLRNHPVLEVTLGSLGYQALIGRDVLNKCLLVFDGPGRSFTLAY